MLHMPVMVGLYAKNLLPCPQFVIIYKSRGPARHSVRLHMMWSSFITNFYNYASRAYYPCTMHGNESSPYSAPEYTLLNSVKCYLCMHYIIQSMYIGWNK